MNSCYAGSCLTSIPQYIVMFLTRAEVVVSKTASIQGTGRNFMCQKYSVKVDQLFQYGLIY